MDTHSQAFLQAYFQVHYSKNLLRISKNHLNLKI